MIWGWERLKSNCFRVFKHLEHSVIYDHLRKDKWLFLGTPAVKVDDLLPCSVHSLLLDAHNVFPMSNAPWDRDRLRGGLYVYVAEGLEREGWMYKIIPSLTWRSGSRANGTVFLFPPFHPFHPPSITSSSAVSSYPSTLCLPVSHSTLYFFSFLFPLLPNIALSLN